MHKTWLIGGAIALLIALLAMILGIGSGTTGNFIYAPQKQTNSSLNQTVDLNTPGVDDVGIYDVQFIDSPEDDCVPYKPWPCSGRFNVSIQNFDDKNVTAYIYFHTLMQPLFYPFERSAVGTVSLKPREIKTITVSNVTLNKIFQDGKGFYDPLDPKLSKELKVTFNVLTEITLARKTGSGYYDHFNYNDSNFSNDYFPNVDQTKFPTASDFLNNTYGIYENIENISMYYKEYVLYDPENPLFSLVRYLVLNKEYVVNETHLVKNNNSSVYRLYETCPSGYYLIEENVKITKPGTVPYEVYVQENKIPTSIRVTLNQTYYNKDLKNSLVKITLFCKKLEDEEFFFIENYKLSSSQYSDKYSLTCPRNQVNSYYTYGLLENGHQNVIDSYTETTNKIISQFNSVVIWEYYPNNTFKNTKVVNISYLNGLSIITPKGTNLSINPRIYCTKDQAESILNRTITQIDLKTGSFSSEVNCPEDYYLYEKNINRSGSASITKLLFNLNEKEYSKLGQNGLEAGKIITGFKVSGSAFVPPANKVKLELSAYCKKL